MFGCQMGIVDGDIQNIVLLEFHRLLGINHRGETPMENQHQITHTRNL